MTITALDFAEQRGIVAKVEQPSALVDELQTQLAASRACLRAELDGLIAQLYGLTESKLAYILTASALVANAVIFAALEGHRAVENGALA